MYNTRSFLSQRQSSLWMFFLVLELWPTSNLLSYTSSESQSSTQVTPSLGSNYHRQMLYHALPIKLDKSNYILWRTQMENVIFANGFEDHIEVLNVCPSKITAARTTNPKFISWRWFDRMILNLLYSSITSEIMGQIVGYQAFHAA